MQTKPLDLMGGGLWGGAEGKRNCPTNVFLAHFRPLSLSLSLVVNSDAILMFRAVTGIFLREEKFQG